MDYATIEAYERYVLAQFKYSDQNKVNQERMDAINSLIPGTLHFYHLYFLNLAKHQKKFFDFTVEEAELYERFHEKHHNTS